MDIVTPTMNPALIATGLVVNPACRCIIVIILTAKQPRAGLVVTMMMVVQTWYSCVMIATVGYALITD